MCSIGEPMGLYNPGFLESCQSQQWAVEKWFTLCELLSCPLKEEPSCLNPKINLSCWGPYHTSSQWVLKIPDKVVRGRALSESTSHPLQVPNQSALETTKLWGWAINRLSMKGIWIPNTESSLELLERDHWERCWIPPYFCYFFIVGTRELALRGPGPKRWTSCACSVSLDMSVQTYVCTLLPHWWTDKGTGGVTATT